MRQETGCIQWPSIPAASAMPGGFDSPGPSDFFCGPSLTPPASGGVGKPIDAGGCRLHFEEHFILGPEEDCPARIASLAQDSNAS